MKQKFTLFFSLWLMLWGALSVSGSPISEAYYSDDGSFVMSDPPAAGFTYVADGGCVPVTVQFYSQLNGPAYSWTFGDGGTSTDCNPVHTYTTPGTYTVTLVATGGTYSTTITVGAVPVVTFGGDSVACLGDMRNYTVASTIPAASYSWSADGGTVTSPMAGSASVTWTSYGVNYLTYTITTASGCTKVFRYKVKVIPPPSVNLPCCDKRQKDGTVQPKEGQHEGVPGGSEPCSVCAGSYSCYEAYLDPTFGISSEYTWNWVVTNGTIVSISADSTKICVVWGSTGVGTIQLTTTHKIYGCQTVRECEVEINPGVTPAFTVTGNCVSSPIVFDATGTTPLSSVESYYWEFGDGYTETTYVPSASHLYAYAGPYTATLTITTIEGCKYKVTQGFNLISGTRPEIACPGTVCEGTRQCYSTALIGSATYTWNITGDIPALRTYSAAGDEVCVTWGSGPVGTITVTVTGGGYTCTNTATEVVAIVGSTIPINAPDFVCDGLFYQEVSTTNYTGACYKWFINGVAQSATTNEMNFNPTLFTSPIKIEVEVTFSLGCCSGRGVKEIKKLPQYTMAPYASTVCIGSTATYYIIFPAGTPTPPVSWMVEGGNIVSSTPTSVTVNWTTVGTGSITAGNNTPSQYCNDGSNNTWNLTVVDKATGDDISGPNVVCGGSTNTYYHGFQSPTGSATVTVSPSTGVVITAGTYSSQIQFPSVTSPTTYTISVAYNHGAIAGCGTVKTYNVTVVPSLIPTFTIPGGTVCEGDTVIYTCPMSDTAFYSWNVIGGSIISENYAAGTLTIAVQWNSTVTSSISVTNKACGTTNTQAVTVDGRPVVIISASPLSCSSTSLTLSVAPVWTSYLWSTTSTTSFTTITTTGTHSVTVSNGVCSNTGYITVPVITPTPPVINSFTVGAGVGPICPQYHQICPNITLGTGAISSYNWTFTGFNISSSTAACPTVALSPSGPGFHSGSWSLTVTDIYGCTSTLGDSLTDSCDRDTCTPIATFNILNYDPCSGLFTTTGTNYSDVFWDFGDGAIGSGASPTHLYASPCNKNVTCLVTDIYGCVKSFSFTIAVPYVIESPHVAVSNSTCNGASTLTAVGVNICSGSSLTASYSWTITPAGGGAPVYTATTTSTTLNVGSLPIPDGDYSVSVQMTVSGCTRTATANFNKGGLRAYFVSCGGCAGSPLTFIDQSVVYNSPIIKWEWSFTTGMTTTNSFLQNPTITFTTAGTYTAQLIITTNNLCKDTFTTTFVIQPPFSPGNILVNGVSTPSNTTIDICPEVPHTLTAPSGAGYTYIWSTGDNTITTAVTEPGEYYVTVFNSSNCAAKIGPIIFRYRPAPEAIIEPVGNACAPRLLRAFRGTGYTYNWSYPVSGTSTQPYIYLNTAGSVTLTVTNVHGCVSTVTQSFSVNPTPSAGISYSPTPFCPGVTVTVTGTPSGGTPPYTHLWNNGNITTSFTTSTPGLYTYTVTDNNQCQSTASLNLQPALPQGLDKLPYGCYDVCSDVTFCAGTIMPYGWTGQWYNGATPFGPVIPGGGSVATTFTSSGTYTLQYIPDNPAVSCAATSRPIVINYIAIPAITITPPTVILCKGSGQSVLLTANPQNPDYNYNWFLNGVYVGSGFTYAATTAGTYTVEVSVNECCSKSATVIVTEEVCCFENPGVPFQQILTDTTISSNQFWYDKYYIDAVVTVVGNAELDLTNVDCVFGPNGTIVMQDQSFLRCNNSVLRPCEKDDIWKGIEFKGSSSGWLNTTTIKNAIIGTYIHDNNRGVRFTDNSFIKCQTSIFIEKSSSQQSISGNTFETDDVILPYPAPANQYWAIRLKGATMNGLIAQNEFRNVRPIKANNIYFGIYSQASNFTASANKFDDMFRAIDVSANSNVVAIEDNQIKINFLKEDYDAYQIRVSDCQNPVLIYENDMDNGLGDRSTAGAIYCAATYRTHIKDNTINGFFEGVFAENTQDIHITSNNITSNISTGITLFEGCDRSIISCNTINSMATNNTQAGNPLYGILEWGGNGSSSIYANCIFNMHTAIYLRGGGNLPALVNNYLYNYRDNGIYTDGYTGSIGAPGGALAAGRNTFMSNNGAAGTTFDINSTVFITEGGNYGVIMTNNVGSTTGTDEFYSTSACGHQIEPSYKNNQLDKYNICDIYNLEEWVFKNADGGYILRDPKVNITNNAIDEMMKANKTEVLGMIAAKIQKGGTDAENTANAVLASKMDKNVAARLVVENNLAINQTQTASTLLQAKELATIDADLKQVLATRIENANTGVFTDAQRMAMKAIDDKNETYSAQARDMVQVHFGDHDFKFKKVPTLEFKEATNTLVRLQNSIKVYPVPATQSVTVEYTVTDAKVQAVKVTSLIGAEIANFEYTIQAGSVNIDISKLAAGMYTVTLVTDDDSKPAMTGRFIKLQ